MDVTYGCSLKVNRNFLKGEVKQTSDTKPLLESLTSRTKRHEEGEQRGGGMHNGLCLPFKIRIPILMRLEDGKYRVGMLKFHVSPTPAELCFIKYTQYGL